MEKENYGKLWEKFLAGSLEREEAELLEKVLGENPDGEIDVFCSEVWASSTDVENGQAGEERSSRMKDKIMGRIAAGEDAERRYARRRRAASAATACFAAAAMLLVAALVHISTVGNRSLEYEVVADRGQKSSVTLPDGSRVWLNSASRISYSSGFNKDDRDIFLQGEAYFEVAKNKKIPFIVHASGLSVCAVGTEFNVRNYPDEDEVRATLVEGRVIASSGSASASLEYGQEAVMDRASGRMITGAAPDLNHLVPWRSSEILLDEVSLAELASILERMYNVDVIFADSSIKEYCYTGLVRNNSLQNVLELISSTTPVDYELSGENIVFRKR